MVSSFTLFSSVFLHLLHSFRVNFYVFVFADPAVDVLNEIGLRLNVNPFFVSFVLAPMASNLSEVIARWSNTTASFNSSVVVQYDCKFP
jgi:hypothetical protein